MFPSLTPALRHAAETALEIADAMLSQPDGEAWDPSGTAGHAARRRPAPRATGTRRTRRPGEAVVRDQPCATPLRLPPEPRFAPSTAASRSLVALRGAR